MKEEKNWKKRDDREKEKALFRVFYRERERELKEKDDTGALWGCLLLFFSLILLFFLKKVK